MESDKQYSNLTWTRCQRLSGPAMLSEVKALRLGGLFVIEAVARQHRGRDLHRIQISKIGQAP